MGRPAFPYVIVSGYKTNREALYYRIGNVWNPRGNLYMYSQYRALDIAIYDAQRYGVRRRHLTIVKNYGTRYERVVWERQK